MNVTFCHAGLVMALGMVLNPWTCSGQTQDPLETIQPGEVAGMTRLCEKIRGTTWVHYYQGGQFPFRFGTNGVIENHQNWQGTPWRVVSSTEVIVGAKNGRGKMIFTFDEAIENFVNLDWDGTPTHGQVLSSGKP